MKYLILIFGIFCCATSIIFLKAGSTDPVVLASYRLILGGLVLSPLAIRAIRNHQGPPPGTLLKRVLPPAGLLSIHFITWITGGRLTPAANASLIVNMVPVITPFFLWFILKEKLNRAESAGTLMALSGVAFLGISDFNLSPEYALGDAICFSSMLFYAAYLVLARKNRDIPSIYAYVVPVYLMAGLICLVAAGIMDLAGRPTAWFGNGPVLQEWVSILGLALVPTVFGHSILNWSMKHLRGQVVAILNPSQFIFAGLMAYFILDEIPSYSFYPASLLIFTGAVIVVKTSHKVA